MTTTYNTIAKETEKAMLINVTVNWADNCHIREFWFPMEIKDWFADKMSKENAFNGYRMNFGI